MKVKNTFRATALGLLIYACSPMTVFATSDTGSAVRDILMDDRFSGAMSRITWLTEMVDNWFIQIITVTAFFIISMSLLKNVMAAAYCAFPNFFNKVHEAHEQMKWSEQTMSGFKEMGNKLKSGKISDVILSIVPDFKAFTDFVDQEISPKAYFMKAIPQMCIMVIIGIFIYNGYYRDVSATVGEAGATIIENVLGSVSPEKAVNDIFNMKSDPKNTYRNDKTIQGGFIKEISNAIYKEVKNYSTVYKETAEGKENLMRSAEYVAWKMVTGDAETTAMLNGWTGGSPFQGTDQYDLKLSNVQVTLSSATTTLGGYCNTDTSDGSRSFRYELPMTMVVNGTVAASEENLQNKIVVVTGNLTPVAKSNKTFETTIEAVGGSQSVVGVGFNTVTVSASTSEVGAQMVNGMASFKVEKLQSKIASEIQGQLPDGCTLVTDSFKYNGTQSGGFVKVNQGSTSQICTVTFNYMENGTNADGQATEPVSKTAEVSVILQLQ